MVECEIQRDKQPVGWENNVENGHVLQLVLTVCLVFEGVSIPKTGVNS